MSGAAAAHCPAIQWRVVAVGFFPGKNAAGEGLYQRRAPMTFPLSDPAERNIQVAGAPLQLSGHEAAGRLVDIDGERFYEIANVDAMPPFLLTVASDSDHWMFVSSTGSLTAGRRTPDQALFPYTTDDRLHDGADHTGPRTIIRVHGAGGVSLWEPFSSRYEGLYRISRSLAKSLRGNSLRFAEVNHDLGLTFSYSWQNSHRFGFVRRASLRNDGVRDRQVDVLDGLQNLLPASLGRRFQMEFSTLADGYKDSELDPGTGLGIFRLSSIPVDAAEPSEALLATTVWSSGLPAPTYLLSGRQLGQFRRGQALSPEHRVRGQRGAYLVASTFTLPAGQDRVFHLVADVQQDAAAVVSTSRLLKAGNGLVAAVEADVHRGTDNLLRIVASADGLQASADELHTARHFANVLFNCQRGGIPADGYTIRRDDLTRFVAAANRRVFERQQRFLVELPEQVPHGHLLAATRERCDPDLERLIREYLPLTFGRRHGDPSRPWNDFAIAVRDQAGNVLLDYQGNWRDLFQNWEALALSFPGYIDSMIFKFVDASTADGHNPYRVTRDGFDWEVQDPHDPWSYIGYWGDHQVIYLQKLLELSSRFNPGALGALLGRRLFTYANVPYRIRPFQAQLADPQDTVDFDHEAHRQTQQRAAELGAEGKTILEPGGDPYRVTLAEKLLVMTLAKLANFVPEAGLWLNTQRPEWNDANNALVGNGASVVTLAYLRRFLQFALRVLAETPLAGTTQTSHAHFEISEEVAEAFKRMDAALRRHLPPASGAIGDSQRRAALEAVALPWSDYRTRIYYCGFSGVTTAVPAAAVQGLFETALRHIDHSLRVNLRPDGLYHSYNLIKITDGAVAIRRLPVMLEGQVAALSSGALAPGAALALLDALRASALYRSDQNSYLLYPDRQLPAFLDNNRLAPEDVQGSPLLVRMIERGDRRIVSRDVDGRLHFHHGFRNSKRLAEALDGLEAPPPPAERQQILDLYERVFDHHSFTGRSGAFYKYEGLGCIYWHMVGKLRLAVQEVLQAAVLAGADRQVLAGLRRHYHQIREGLGMHKPPALHGAVPTDPYSHTPGFIGAQQPGMTGQVKEDVLARLGEMGAAVVDGRLVFDRALVTRDEFLPRASSFCHVDVSGQQRKAALAADTMAFTFCQVLVVVHRPGPPRLAVSVEDGSTRTVDGLTLDRETSARIFGRAGTVQRLDVFLGLDS